MFNSLVEAFKKGVALIRDNSQLTYTLVIAVVIFGAFVFTSNQFVQIAQDAQDRLINVRVGSIQDAFVPFAKLHLNDPQVLNQAIKDIITDNSTIQEFRVVQFIDSQPIIVSSIFKQEIGLEEKEVLPMIDFARVQNENSITFPVTSGSSREYVTLRAINNDNAEVVGMVITRQSLSVADQKISESIQNSIIVLIVVMIIVLLLFFRHARIIDYTTLYKKLQGIDQLKDDFISMASHELRTPLTVIRGYAELLGESKNLDEKDQKNVGVIDTASKQLSNLVSDMLDVSRIEQGRMKFEFQILNPNDLVSKVFETFEITASQKNLDLKLEKGPDTLIKADPDRLRQVIVNLLGNSVKYTSQGGVKLMTSIVDNQFEIRISDTGIGISAEDQKRLFSKFYRVKSKETQAIVGTGLGLWITKQIIETMGGTITVESIKSKGSDFIVRLPITKERNDK